MPRHVAYIRRSTAGESNPGDTSREVQEQAIREMARRDGHDGDVEWFVDWGKSADEAKLSKRTEYARLMKAVDAGEVEVIYAYALDRLHRSVSETGKLMKAVEANHVRLVTLLEGEISEADPAKWLLVTMLSTMGEFALRQMKVRANANIARRKTRGDDFGYAPYGQRIDTGTHRLVPREDEDVAAVVESYERAGSFGGAARLLNTDEGLLARAKPRRGKWWSENTIARVLRREGTVGQAKAKGWSQSRAPEDFPLYRLLVCPHDQGRLTAMRTTSGNGKRFNRYFCSTARRDPTHPRPYAVAESFVLPWLSGQAEGMKAVVSSKTYSSGGSGERRDELERKRKLLGIALADETIELDAYEERKVAIDSELAALPDPDAEDVTITARRVRVVRFDAEPAALARSLRMVVERIVLDKSMRPVKVIWRGAPARQTDGKAWRKS